MARKSKLGEITELNRRKSNNKNVFDVTQERDRGHYELVKWQINDPTVRIEWGMNKYTEADQLCRITVGKESALVSAEDLQRALRWV